MTQQAQQLPIHILSDVINASNVKNETEGRQSKLRLDSLKVGDSAIITDVLDSQELANSKGNHLSDSKAGLSESQSKKTQTTQTAQSTIARRLKELGFVKGETVRILHKGYFGGEPLAVRIGQSTFALRRFEAALIGITSVNAAL